MGSAATASEALKLPSPAAYAIALGSGVVLTVAFPEPDVAPVAWVAIAPLLLVSHRQPVRRGLGLGFVFGLGFFGSLLYWISLVGWAAWTVLVVLQAAYIALFGAGWAIASSQARPWMRPAVAAALWVAVEFFRGTWPVGGFTWGQLAQSQHDVLWLLRSAQLGGGWLTAAVIVAANSMWMEAWLALRRSAWIGLAAAVVAGALVLAWPALLPSPEAGERDLTVAIVQGNVPRRFEDPSYEKELAIIRSHRELTEELDAEADLVVWPESSIGIDPRFNPPAAAALRDAASAAAAPMVVGGNLNVDEDRYKVVAMAVSADGAIADVYQKTHLVPFGEWVPFRPYLGWLPILDQVPRDAVRGDRPALFSIADGEVAPVISFEGDFGPLVRDRIDRGGRLLVVATNTSTWGDTWASAQHVAFSQVRAAETGVWVVHAALSGISAFVAPGGRLLASTDLWTRATLVEDVAFADGVTFYARTGEWFPWVAVTVSVLAIIGSIVVSRCAGTVE